MKNKVHNVIIGLVVFLILLIDQTTKYYAFHLLGGEKKIVLIKSILELTYFENTGAAFSSFVGKNIAITASVICRYMYCFITVYNKLSDFVCLHRSYNSEWQSGDCDTSHQQ